jgi:hypothetical protein
MALFHRMMDAFHNQSKNFMNTFEDQPCWEIVEFGFTPDSTFEQQAKWMQELGRWVAAQPGFESRQSFYDAGRGRWLDQVAWRSLSFSKEALERCEKEASLGIVFSAIDQSTMSMGHYLRLA